LISQISASPEAALKSLENFAPLQHFAALCFMAVYAEAFEPAIVDGVKYFCPQAMLDLRSRSQRQVSQLLASCRELLLAFKEILALPLFENIDSGEFDIPPA